MYSPPQTADSLETDVYRVQLFDDENATSNNENPVLPMSLHDLQVKFYLRTVALGKALKYADEMPFFGQRRLSDILEMLKYVNNIVHVLQPYADLGYDLPAEIMETIVKKLPPFLQMSWRELVKRGEGSGYDVHRLREWLVKRATDKLVETMDVLENNGFDMSSVFKNSHH